MSTEENQIKDLKTARALIKAKLTRFNTFFQNVDNKNKINEIKSRLDAIQGCLSEFENLCLQLEILEQDCTQELNDFENIFYETVTEAKKHIEQASSDNINSSQNRPSSINSNETNIQLKLPNIHLPVFNGQFTEWVTFRDTFKSLIHDNEQLSNIQRFHYLKSSVKSVALQTIEHLTISENNYIAAWDLLESRYENKRLIIQHHLRAIFQLPSLNKDVKILRQLLHGLITNIKSLESIQRPVEHWDDILIYLISTKFDYHTTMAWENQLSNEPPTFENLTNFLTQRCQMLESIEINSAHKKPSQPHNTFNNSSKNHHKIPVTHLNTKSRFNTCLLCKQPHKLYQCQNFKSKSIEQRLVFVKNNNLCENCLRVGHSVENCVLGGCKTCNLKHNSLLHLPNESNPSSNVTNNVVSNVCDSHVSTNVLLSTALVYIKDSKNETHTCRVLLDSGSQSNFITTKLCNKLGLNLKSINISVTGINQSENNIANNINVNIQSRINSCTFELDCLVLEKITANLPLRKFSKSNLNIPSNISLADPTFNIPGEIDILIGAEIFWELLGDTKMQTNVNKLYLHQTQLGFILGGKLSKVQERNSTVCNVSVDTLDKQMSKFWEIEGFNNSNLLTPDEQACEKHFKENLIREPSGRFSVKLPFRQHPPDLGSSKQTAMKRFISLENKFKINKLLENDYKTFINEYHQLGHLERVTSLELQNIANSNCYYLAHHAVFKDSSTTKLRVVFDGSCRTSNGKSLNDNLLVGPALQQNLFYILTRFRMHQYVISGDIAKMYRQILIQPNDRNYQLILWREQPHTPIQTYRLKTVTYGLASSPYLAIKCLHELAALNADRYPDTHKIIIRDFYVDDVLTGADSIDCALKIRKDITTILAEGGFELRKFASNSPLLLPHNEMESKEPISLDMQLQNKTLGVIWDHSSDSIKYSVNDKKFSNKHSKRGILSVISCLFDPLGLASPITIVAKIILQEVWSLKVNWDEDLPSNLKSKWIEFLDNFIYLNQLTISRKVIPNSSYIRIEMHGFCDSSQKSYGACVYLRTIYASGQAFSNLLCAKSRVTPIKTVTIPRLELLAAVLLSQLINKLKQNLHITINQCIYWTDSTIVLSWIKMHSNSLKTFVANRVSEIQSLTSSNEWRHISSVQNPADILSRGTTPQNLIDNKLWWHGPELLMTNNISFSNNSSPSYEHPSEIPEVKSICCSLVSNISTTNFDLLTKYSSWSKTLRIMAYVLRFIHNVRKPKIKNIEELTVEELQTSHDIIIKITQLQAFGDEIHSIKKHGDISNTSKLKTLNPFMDKHGLLRVGGRLRNSLINYTEKHQLILPKNHHITHLIITYYHIQQLHAGCQSTMAAIRKKYWILACRSSVRFIIFKCIKCFKLKPTSMTQLMGDLPDIRITPSRPFTYTAIDYAGPIIIKNGHGRTTKTLKSYIAVFVCFATKAVHLELVCDCTSSTFLNSLKRFMARRGKVSMLYSDNGTNFVGANRELQNLFKSQQFKNDVINSLTLDQIKWKFIPPRSPHMNGLAEAAVKSTKRHLKLILGNSLLNYEEMYTVLTMIEACLNSRPISPLSNDPDDLSALTPGHFLIGDALTAPAEPDLMQTAENRLSRYQLLEKLRQHFWVRWSKEYLQQLQTRVKWNKVSQQPTPGTLVLLREDNIPPQNWILGRIQTCHPGADGLTRTVSVKTVRGIVKRAISKICPLPIDNSIK